MKPVPHSEELIAHTKASKTCDIRWRAQIPIEVRKKKQFVVIHTTFEPRCSSEPHLLTQEDLEDLIRDLKLSKKQSEMFGSRLKGWNLLQRNTKICTYRSRHSQCKDYFSEENGLVFCNDISSLMETFGSEHNPIEWRLFIDSSKTSSKAVLLHNGNKFPSIQVVNLLV
ncbi:uncharacterized protein TNCV_2505041 [Trichonephila clavipes]|uniref:Uncharacterized protein n=1 Tax=Trichonephila clavipes TaxID=2585209 RepID=A0A8X7BJK9_TRICX|nr:uncharacterized protein TNCV_2505041 [Trichonephila clavipes]